MFKILNQTFRTGIVTTRYPDAPANVAEGFRGLPKIDYAAWHDAAPAAADCPTGAIAVSDHGGLRDVTVDYGLCVFCGLCAEATPEGAIQITREFELAVEARGELVVHAEYILNYDGSHRELTSLRAGTLPGEPAAERAGRKLKEKISRLYGRSLAIRQVDAGSCNGCELEIHALNNPIYDIERFGIHFVASPRHADMLLVTGPVTRNMEVALKKTYLATPDPRLVVAVGTCGISGGIFGRNYASLGGVDEVIPVDVYIPGCPPRPQALLQGILMAIGRAEGRVVSESEWGC
ncbi:NADH-quinone oxidoreductase subunit NuoB [Paludibaculum fermentans]|uniref:NADH-quinone oxidoreductase subunit NuoB n=1 Tax=Paludibaculum fermentans TaxID=1473598 RepID=UPI003EBB3BF7